MDINKIQSILESLPDQDIAKYAQAPSAQVPQVLAQMELQRRATLRQAAQMKGGQGMFAGGPVRRFEKGGLAAMQENFNKRQAREDEILEEAKRKRGEQMKEAGGVFDVLGAALNPMPALRTANQAVKDVGGGIFDLLSSGARALVPDAVAENYHRQKMRQDPEYAAKVASEQAASIQAGEKNLAAAQSAASVPPAPAPTTPPTPQTGVGQSVPATKTPVPGARPPVVGSIPSVAKPEVSPVNKGLGSVAPSATPGADVDADPRMVAMKAELDKFGDITTKGVAEELSLRKQALVPVNEEKERNRQLYTALGQWGTALLLTRNYGIANATALQTLQKELAASEEKRKAFKKEALDLALADVKSRMELAGLPVEKMKALNDLSFKLKAELREQTEQDRKNRDTDADIKFKEGSLDINRKNADTNRINAEQSRAGGANQELTFEDALKLAEEQIKNDKINSFKYKTPQARQQAVQSLAQELYNKNLAVLRAVRGGAVPTYPGASVVPEGVKVTQVKP